MAVDIVVMWMTWWPDLRFGDDLNNRVFLEHLSNRVVQSFLAGSCMVRPLHFGIRFDQTQ
jgi:hypothetical protein